MPTGVECPQGSNTLRSERNGRHVSVLCRFDIAEVGNGNFSEIERSGNNDHRFRRRGLSVDGALSVFD